MVNKAEPGKKANKQSMPKANFLCVVISMSIKENMTITAKLNLNHIKLEC
jgi:hypothetical protein